MYKIHRPFRSAFHILTPTYNKVMGVEQKTYTDVGLLFASVRDYRTDEKDVDKLEKVSSVKVCQTMFSSVLSASTVLVDKDGGRWKIIGDPEDLHEGGHFLQFKIRRISGGA